MPTPTPTAEIDTGAELARRLAIKREITATLADGAQSTTALAEQVDGVSTALVRQLADELAADGEIELCDDPVRRSRTDIDNPYADWEAFDEDGRVGE